MSNILNKAADLEKVVRDSDEFNELKSAFLAVMGDANAKDLFEKSRNTQLELQDKQMQGEEITEEDVTQAQEIFETAQKHDKIATLMQKEEEINNIINDIGRVITQPLEELYDGELG